MSSPGVLRGLAGRLALLSGSLILSLGLVLGALEAYLRLTDRRSPEAPGADTPANFNPFRTDPVLGYALRPDWTALHERRGEFRVVVRTNALGLRGAAAAPEAAPGTRRVLVIGDSFTFGFGVEDGESFPALLDGLLGPRVEVLNAGVPGWSIDHQWLFWKERGRGLAPDLVLLATCSNDVGELGWSSLELDARNLPARTESQRWRVSSSGRLKHLALEDVPLPDLPLGRWAAYSEALNFLRVRLATLLVRRAERRELERDEGRAPEGPIEALRQDEVLEGLSSGGAFRHRYYRYVREALRQDAAARGIDFRVVHVGPRRHQVADACVNEPECLDVALLLDREKAPEAFFVQDGHWTPEGHRRVAAALAAWLAEAPALAPAAAPSTMSADNDTPF